MKRDDAAAGEVTVPVMSPFETQALRGLADLKDEIGRVRTLLDGGTKPAEGLIVRVDRLEQVQQSRTWGLRALGTATIGSLVAALWALLTKQH